VDHRCAGTHTNTFTHHTYLSLYDRLCPCPGELGDYYYYGHGTEVNYKAAAGQYRIASDKQASVQAIFNLGCMYKHRMELKKVAPPGMVSILALEVVDW